MSPLLDGSLGSKEFPEQFDSFAALRRSKWIYLTSMQLAAAFTATLIPQFLG